MNDDDIYLRSYTREDSSERASSITCGRSSLSEMIKETFSGTLGEWGEIQEAVNLVKISRRDDDVTKDAYKMAINERYTGHRPKKHVHMKVRLFPRLYQG